MDEDRAALLKRYREGPNRIAQAVLKLSDALLDYKPADGGWSPREVVHHTADSEMTSAIRVRLLLASDRPHITSYDENEFSRRLHYDRPIDASLDAFKAARRTTADILDRASEPDWTREGTHTEVGRYTMDTWLEIYAAHAHNHAGQIRRAREAAKRIG